MRADFQLGDYTVRPQLGRLERDGEITRLTPKAMGVLVCLADAGGGVISRNDLLDTVWPSMIVSDDVLTQNVVELRKAFGDSARNPQFIETIPKIGFRLIPPVTPLQAQSAVVNSTPELASGDPIVKQLYQRKMFRIAAGYLVIFWGLWEIVVTTCPTIECTIGFQQTIFWTLLSGLPITLAVAWINWRTAILVGVSILAGTSAMFYLMHGPQQSDHSAMVPPASSRNQVLEVEPIRSVAVLPFADMSAAGDQAYFSDGISEEILNGLAKVEDLRVAARTSAFILRGQSIDVVGEKLNVNYVLEGSVRKAGNRLRISTQLIKVDDGFHQWSETYDRELTDIFVIQEEIAKAVVNALKIELGIVAGGKLVGIGTSNREAYDWYLRGKYALITGTAMGFKRGVEYFSQAIEIDSNYADAYAYIAYARILQHPYTPYSEIAPAIKQAYSRALELEASHSAALCAQGYDKILSDWDWPGAGKVFQAATQDGRVNDVCLGSYFYVYLGPLGQSVKSIAILRNAQRVDPLNIGIKYMLGNHLGFYSGEFDEAITLLHAVLDAEPDRIFALTVLTGIYLNAGQFDDAESVLTRLENLKAPNAYPYAMLMRVELEVLRGDTGKAQSIYDEGLRVAKSGANKSPDLWVILGFSAVLLGHLDDAINFFDRSLEKEAYSVVYIRPFVTSWPAYTQGYGPALMARSDFQAFLKRMNLDDASIAALEAVD